MKGFKILFSVIILALVSVRGLAQQVDVFRVGSSGEFLRPKGVSSSKVHEIYVDSAWEKTSILIEKNETPDVFLARYDLRSNRMELKMQNGINVIEAKFIKSYTALDKQNNSHVFINGKNFVLNRAPLTAMIEVLCAGKASLYKRYNYYIKMPDYNAALATGNPDEQVFLEPEVYYSFDNKTLVRLPSKRKKLIEIFGEKSPQIEAYIRQSKLNTSNDLSLVSVFNYFNTL